RKTPPDNDTPQNVKEEAQIIHLTREDQVRFAEALINPPKANARLALAQLYARQARWDAAARELDRAAAFQDDGALGAAVRSQGEALLMVQERDTWPNAAAGVIGR
ncbi:MAG TPA: DUF1778 domain-containing protein, partial [Polyangiaceae bacterium]|nr:DUF1778 domain-containing protein [Polyangiaceae bacterium]